MYTDEQRAIIDQALKIIRQRFRRGASITSPMDTKRILAMKLADCYNECFVALFLDARHRLIAYEELFFGTVDGASVHSRVVVQRALHHNASALIVAHNHPSGVAEPSSSDQAITRRLSDALALVDVRLLDHFVVGADGVTSLAEKGMM